MIATSNLLELASFFYESHVQNFFIKHVKCGCGVLRVFQIPHVKFSKWEPTMPWWSRSLWNIVLSVLESFQMSKRFGIWSITPFGNRMLLKYLQTKMLWNNTKENNSCMEKEKWKNILLPTLDTEFKLHGLLKQSIQVLACIKFF